MRKTLRGVICVNGKKVATTYKNLECKGSWHSFECCLIEGKRLKLVISEAALFTLQSRHYRYGMLTRNFYTRQARTFSPI